MTIERPLRTFSQKLWLVSLAIVLAAPPTVVVAQQSEWSATSTNGLRLEGIYHWNASDSLFAYDSGLVRTTHAPTSVLMDVVGGAVLPGNDFAELRRPVETNVWLGAGIGAAVGGMLDAGVVIGNRGVPGGYLPGVSAFVGTGFGALVALAFGSDEVYHPERMVAEEREMAFDMRLPAATTADRARSIVTIDNRAPEVRRISLTSWWVRLSSGGGVAGGSTLDPSVGIGLGYFNRKHVALIDAVGWGRVNVTARGNVAAHYGRAFFIAGGTMVLSGGPGVSWRADDDDIAAHTYTIPSGTVRMSIAWLADRWLGFGVAALAGVNDRGAFGGFQFSAYTGDLD